MAFTSFHIDVRLLILAKKLERSARLLSNLIG
jgi:hypothetical protein